MESDVLKNSVQALCMPDDMKKRLVQACKQNPNTAFHQEATMRKPRARAKKLILVPVIMLLSAVIAVPAFAGTIPAVYDLLYVISPATAQFFKPVQMISENNGIRMEVVSAYVQGNTMEALVTLQDTAGERVDASTDLFDSYNIKVPFEHSSGCAQVGFDQTSGIATFLVTISQGEERSIKGDKITFALKQFMSGKSEYEGALCDVKLNLDNKETSAETLNSQTNEQPYFSGGGGERYAEFAANPVVLIPTENQATPIDGVTITASGYIDGYLHIQVHYDDILETDNHGYLSFITSTGEEVHSIASLSFWDDEHKGSYQDYIFETSATEAEASILQGYFVTGGTITTGPWQVTFPVE